MRILVTNDDGIDSEGLIALKRSLSKIGDVVVIAPDHNWSAAGHTKTMHKPLRVSKVTLPDGDEGFASDGTPSDCVALCMLGLAGERPSLVVSGINKGANLGGDITYSGTVAAAMESIMNGVPAIAMSLASYREWDFEPAAEFAAILAKQVLEENIAPDVLLNVNVPPVAKSNIQGVQVTRLGRRIYRDRLIERQDPFGRSYYWIGGDEPTGYAEEGTDIWALANNFISVTPIHMDLTNHSIIDRLKGLKLTF
ncbi:MAG: 5'/3'-nucleotidase SurE [Chloroflexota bacterium]|jgi:5'-nucleotidase